ncbi:MAG: hypothetical protein ACOWWM_20180 [Desulfobacterales bacterium]
MQRIQREFIERRTGRERRRSFSIGRFRYSGPDRRRRDERRSPLERRDGWIRVSKWSSAPLRELKISKYLLGKVRLTQNNPYPGDF